MENASSPSSSSSQEPSSNFYNLFDFLKDYNITSPLISSPSTTNASTITNSTSILDTITDYVYDYKNNPTFKRAAESFSQIAMETITSALGSLFMIFGPVIGYVSQYSEIKKRKNASGFSTLVSLILLVSNILRCFFWLGKRFDVTLVYQAVVMIIAQLIMLQLCVSLGEEGFYEGKSQRKKGFWKWTDFSYYIYFLIGFSGIVLIFTTILGSWPGYFELIGFLSLSIESMLGVPQLIKNYNSHSTQGLSFTLIASWFIGDAFKTIYFAFTGAPTQFLMCGAIQLVVDIMILAQMALYKPPTARM